jgi:hypothetical protein
VTQPGVKKWLDNKTADAEKLSPPDSRQHFDVWAFATADKDAGQLQLPTLATCIAHMDSAVRTNSSTFKVPLSRVQDLVAFTNGEAAASMAIPCKSQSTFIRWKASQ